MPSNTTSRMEAAVVCNVPCNTNKEGSLEEGMKFNASINDRHARVVNFKHASLPISHYSHITAQRQSRVVLDVDMLGMDRNDFEQLVALALERLPLRVRAKIDNVAFCIEDRPTAAQLTRGGVKAGGALLGLYEGVPQIVYARGQMTRLPDKITIFQESIERIARTPAEIEKLVKETVWHEIAHHFGFDEHGARRLDAQRKRMRVSEGDTVKTRGRAKR